MQGFLKPVVTTEGFTFESPMERPRANIEEKPMSAPRDRVDDVLRRIEALGVTVNDAAAGAKLSRQTGWRLKKGAASISTVKDVEEWLVREEAQRRKSQPVLPAVAEFSSLGEELSEIDPAEFDRILGALREIVQAERMRQNAYTKMFRPTPDRRR